jgi:hypothetical protein
MGAFRERSDDLWVRTPGGSLYLPVYGIDGTPAEGDVPAWDDTAKKLVFGAGGGGASELDDLSDVSISSPLAGHYLRFNGTIWVNQTLQDGDLPADLGSNARVGVRKNSAGSTHKRRRINLIEGSGIGLTIADDATDEEVDVTLTNTGQTGGTQSGGVPWWVQKHPVTKPASPGSLDDYWDDSTGMSGPGSGLNAKWTKRGATTLNEYFQGGRLVLEGPASGGGSPNLALIDQSAPGGNWTAETMVVVHSINNSFSFSGITVRSDAGKIWLLYLSYAGQVGINRYSAFNNRTSFNSPFTVGMAEVYMRVEYDGTNLVARACILHGVDKGYFAIQTDTLTAAFASSEVPAGVGLGVDPFNTLVPVASFGYFRVS